MEGGLPISGCEALGMWVRPEEERGSQDYWREQMDFMVCLLGLGMESTSLYKLSLNTVQCPQLRSVEEQSELCPCTSWHLTLGHEITISKGTHVHPF